MMAARSLILLYREHLPTLLHKKDRGRPTEASIEIKPKQYGEVATVDHILGTEILLKEPKKSTKVQQKDDSGSESDSGWVDLDQDGDVSVDEDESDDEENEDSSDDEGSDLEEGDEDKPDKPIVIEKTKEEIQKEEREAAKELALTKIFTDADFARIEGGMIKKKVTHARKRKAQPEKTQEKSEYVRLNDIEMIYKKRRTDKQARIESQEKGREGRDKFGYKDGRHTIHCSKTNREKEKTKNFQMIRHKVRGKVKKSFRDKQLTLRKHLIQQKKMK